MKNSSRFIRDKRQHVSIIIVRIFIQNGLKSRLNMGF